MDDFRSNSISAANTDAEPPKVCVAVMDTGIFRHRDFGGRIVGFCDCVGGKNTVYDDSGHGTHVAGIIAGSGASSNGKYAGLAGGANIVAVKVLDSSGNGKIDDVLRGVDWLMENHGKYNIRVVNISFGSAMNLDSDNASGCGRMVEGIERLWDSGMVVVAAAGNSGPKPGSVTAPGVSRKVVTVGAFDEVRFRSGRGPTKDCVVKPEVLVRGTNIVSCSNIQGRYAMKSGTSMAAPIVSGAVARLLQKNPTLTPGVVKLKIHDSAIMQEKYRSLCAWGVLDVGRLLKS
jgi:serine protease AprX